MTIEGDNLGAMITSKGLLLEIKHDRDNEEFYNFEIVAALEKDKASFNFDLYSNLNLNSILKKWAHFLGMAIRWRAQGWTTFPMT